MARVMLRLSGGPLVITTGCPMTSVGRGVKNRATLALAIWARTSALGDAPPDAGDCDLSNSVAYASSCLMRLVKRSSAAVLRLSANCVA
jgi:hypothetical protein